MGIQAKWEFSEVEELPKSFMEEVVFHLDLEQFIYKKYLVSFTWAEGVQVPVCLLLLGLEISNHLFEGISFSVVRKKHF